MCKIVKHFNQIYFSNESVLTVLTISWRHANVYLKMYTFIKINLATIQTNNKQQPWMFPINPVKTFWRSKVDTRKPRGLLLRIHFHTIPVPVTFDKRRPRMSLSVMSPLLTFSLFCLSVFLTVSPRLTLALSEGYRILCLLIPADSV